MAVGSRLSRLSTPEEVRAHFDVRASLLPDERRYLAFHRARYAALLLAVSRLLGARPARLLDVGPSFQTVLMRDAFPEAQVDTLGVDDPASSRRDFMQEILAGGRHYTVDLNAHTDGFLQEHAARYDGIVLAEVLEHLHRAPTAVLRFLGGLLVPGGWIVLQTPNACAAHKRIQMLVGRNPLPPIGEWQYEAHFHEYTVGELRSAALAAGLRPVACSTANYFSRDTRTSRLYNAVAAALPPTLRAGITMTLRTPDAA
jgi:SAM-dependent methyltransferase